MATMFCLHWHKKGMIGNNVLRVDSSTHIQRSFVDHIDKTGAQNVTERHGPGTGGQETTAVRPKDSAESNEGQLSLRMLPRPPENKGERLTNNLGGQIS